MVKGRVNVGLRFPWHVCFLVCCVCVCVCVVCVSWYRKQSNKYSPKHTLSLSLAKKKTGRGGTRTGGGGGGGGVRAFISPYFNFGLNCVY